MVLIGRTFFLFFPQRHFLYIKVVRKPLGQMKNNDIAIPTIAIVIIVLTSIIPVIQVIMMTLNGGLIYIFTVPFESENHNATIVYVVNSILIVTGMFCFYLTKQTGIKIVTVILVLFAGQAIMLLAT